MPKTLKEKADYARSYWQRDLEKSRSYNRMWRKKNAYRMHDLARWYKIKQSYGLDKAGYNAMMIAQGCRCAICRRLPCKTPLAVDHDHSKKKGDPGFVRGLLCRHCNHVLGHAHDSVLVLEAAIRYLEVDRGGIK